jgi:hypothetical protein
MSIGKTATQLERMITERLRGNPGCFALYRVVVIPQAGGAWTTSCEVKMGMTISSDCERTVDAIARDLRRSYHLESGH